MEKVVFSIQQLQVANKSPRLTANLLTSRLRQHERHIQKRMLHHLNGQAVGFFN